MFQAPKDIQAWPIGGSRDTASYSLLPFLSTNFLLVLQWFTLPVPPQAGTACARPGPLSFGLSDLLANVFSEIADSFPFIGLRRFN